MNEAPKDSLLAEDAQTLVDQSERCRKILRELSRKGAEQDLMHTRHSLAQALDEVCDPLRGVGPAINVVLEPQDPDDDGDPPVIRRSPEMLYGVSNYVENAIDFARTKITVIGRWNKREIEVLVRDDGPGFPSEVLSKLGEPFVTTRPGGSDGGHGGLGLGFFIAKTLLERSHGRIAFGNSAAKGGAVVRITWPRDQLSAPAE